MPNAPANGHANADASPTQLDPLDRRLLDLLQSDFPLVHRPFAAVAERAGTDEATCLARVRALRHERGVIRQISAIFDTQALGYRSSLVAAAVDPDAIETAAEAINAHPGVSHNYQRPGAYNLWYTLAVPPDSKLGLDATIERLHALSGANASRPLPTLKLFKIGVRFNMTGAPTGDAAPAAFSHADRDQGAAQTIDESDKPLIRALQRDLPIESAPFERWAQEAGCSVSELLDAADRYHRRKQMRRFAAVLNHRRAGARSNVMAVWAAPDDRIEQLGATLAGFHEVSHCYHRPAYPDWPFNLYTMVHAPDREAALATLRRMQRETAIERYEPMWSLREFKKVRLRYFTGETEAWEAANG